MNYSVLKKILIVSAVFTAYESNIDAAQFNKPQQNDKITIMRVDQSKNNNYFNKFEYSKEFKPEYKNNIIPNNIFGNYNNYMNNNKFMRRLNLSSNNSNNNQKGLLNSIVDNLCYTISNLHNNNNINELLDKLDEGYTGSKWYDLHSRLQNIIKFNSSKMNANKKSDAIDLLSLFKIMYTLRLKVSDNNENYNYKSIYNILLDAAEKIDDKQYESLEKLVINSVSGDNSRDIISTIVSIIEKSDAVVDTNSIINVNEELQLKDKFKLKRSENNKVYNNYYMFEAYKSLNKDNANLINSTALEPRRNQLNKLLNNISVNEAVDEAKYSMMLGSDMFDKGHEGALNNFIAVNKTKSFKSVADLYIAINFALGKKEFGELKEQGVDNGKREEKKQGNGDGMSAEEFYEKNGLSKYIDKEGNARSSVRERAIAKKIIEYENMLKAGK